MDLLEVKNISKTYGTGEATVHALKDATFSVPKGEFVAVVGESGSGKSTLLNMIGALDTPTSGKVFIDSKDIFSMKERNLTVFRRRNIGFIFQSFNLIDELTVYENVELPLVYMGIKTAQRKEKVNKVLEKVNLLHRANHYPQQLSGGQQQRVAIARAVVTDCKLLLADEPTGNLDSATSMEVVELLKSCAVRFHQTTLIVTHQEEVAQMTDRVIRMSDGKIYTRDCNDC